MPTLIPSPTVIAPELTAPKKIEEFIGRVNSDDDRISLARMTAPQGWDEPGQRPTFAEYTLVLKGMLTVETEGETLKVAAGQALVTEPGEWIRYSTPDEGGAEYVAVCLPAFSPDTVHRD